MLCQMNVFLWQVGDEMDEDAVIALQEVSKKYGRSLQPFFARHDYHVVTTYYGSFFSGYMGVLIAVPAKYELLDCVSS